MVNNDIYHAGTKGMKWGQRLYQNKDGSLTPLGKLRYGSQSRKEARAVAKAKAEAEAVEAKRTKLLKSTDAKEIYENRSLLSTQELNDRLNRINTEQRLSDLANKSKKSGYDRIDSVLKFGKKANEVYEFTNTPMMKQIKKKLFGDKVTVKDTLGLKKALDNIDNLSDKDLSDIIGRASKENALKKLVNDLYK